MGRIGLIALGVLLFVIARAHGAGAPETLAAEELHHYLGQMTSQQPAAEVRIDPALGDGEAFAIDATGDQVKISGSNGYMTLFAAYQYLDGQGCRFLSPALDFYQGAAEIIPGKRSLTAVKVSGKPAMKLRKLYVEEGHSHTPENLAQLVEWMPKVGYNTLVVPANYQGAGKVMWDHFRERVTPECQKRGITIEVGGHGYQNFLNSEMEGGKLFEMHPEWFGMDADGKRRPEHQHVFCSSNPAAVDYLIKNFVAYVKDRPEIQIYDFWPPDGARWCECEECKKLGAPADREAILVKQVQDRVKAIRPDLRLEFIAYQLAITPPEHAAVDHDTLIDFCPISQQFDRQINDPVSAKNKEYADALLAWRKAFDGDISIYSYYRKYAWDSLPVIIPHYMQKDLQWFAGVPVQGVSTYSEPGDWYTYELNHYALAALAWDPNVNVDELVKKFCDARYGSESALAMETFALLEKVVRNDCSLPNLSLKTANEIADAQFEMQKEFQRLMKAKMRTTDKSISRSLGRLVLMCGYAANDLEIQQLRASGASKDQIGAKVDELHQFLQSHADEGVFLIKDQRGSTSRMSKRYGAGVKS